MISTRREFLQATGTLAISFALPACSARDDQHLSGRAILGNRLVISAAGEVQLRLGKVEFGQGIGTALAQIAAEELDIDFARIRLIPVDTSISPDEFYTFSSISIQQSGPPTRRAAAAAQQHLLQKAAAQLNVAAHELRVSDGEILSGNQATGTNYWQLIGNENIEIDVSEDQALKSVDQYSIVGKSYERIDIPGKVFGVASYLQDLRLPGMVHARVVRSHAERAVIHEFGTSAAETMPGVLKVIRDGNFVAVVAVREQQARDAAQALRDSITWNLPGDLPDENAIFDLLRTAPSRTESVATILSESDDVDTTTVSGTYRRHYQAHASISPSAAIAQFVGDKLTVWSHAQGMYPLRAGLAHVLNLDIENVRCLHREASGCYGHNGADDAACDAAAIAMHYPGKPVRLQWERADEMAWEPYGSAMRIEVSADVDEAGDIRDWKHDIWSYPHSSRPRNSEQAGNLIYARHREQPLNLPGIQSIAQPNGGADRNGVPLYAFDNIEVRKHLLTDVPIRVSALRGLGAYANVFSIESIMDELAHRANVDPLDYRIRHMRDKRAIAVLRRLGEVSDWYERTYSGDEGGWGLAFARFKNRSSYLGIVTRITVDPETDKIELQHATAVCDAGLVINPDGASAQIEGGIIQSASWTLKEKIRFSQEAKQSLDWASYPILRFDGIPTIDVEFMPRDDQPSLGVGETAQGPTAAAIANAVHAATGRRLRTLPLAL